MKPTLTPQEHRRVDQVMGVSPTSVDGLRRCRCGELVPHTPNDMWEHALACEKRQERDARAAAAARAHVDEVLQLAGDR